jgi:peptidoglycan/xylan/chitin deacetylase (PgdA/CDA1 family)
MEKYANLSFEASPTPSTLTSKIREIAKNILLSTLGNISFNYHGNYLRCIYFHWVFDNNVHDFEKIINFFRSRGEFIDTDRCCAMVEGKEQIDSEYYHISFDDGFKNNLYNAARILRKLRVPACFFVPTSLIGASYSESYNHLVESKRYKRPIEMLSWGDCKQLLDWGFDVGSHTRTHARLSEISERNDLLEQEIRGSKEDIEDSIGYECKYISWPYGLLKDVNQKVIDKIREVGYKACFGAFRGKITPDSSISLYTIPRNHVEADWPISHVNAIVTGILGG